jgi:hypothetical protein
VGFAHTAQTVKDKRRSDASPPHISGDVEMIELKRIVHVMPDADAYDGPANRCHDGFISVPGRNLIVEVTIQPMAPQYGDPADRLAHALPHEFSNRLALSWKCRTNFRVTNHAESPMQNAHYPR